jgi:lysozyme
MANKPIQAFRLQTRLEVDATKAHAEWKASEADVKRYGAQVTKTAKEASSAFKGGEVGKKWGSDFGASAVSSITGSLGSLGQTLGSVIGTAIAPGIGTAIGSTLGSGIDTALGKISGPLMAAITGGIELNKELERTTAEFTTFAGSEKEALKYLTDLKKQAIDTGTDFRWVVDTSEHVFDLTDDLKLTNTILKASTDQAADFGGKAETIGKIAEQLGLIAEKGSLASRELQKLYKLGIDAKKYLAEATGMTEKQIEGLMAADRIRGNVAARLIAEGIEREKGGFAAKVARTTTYGAEARFNVLTQIRAQEGTAEATRGLGDFYRQADAVLDSPQAKKLVDFINQTTGSVINWVERGLKSGINLGAGIAQGISSGETMQALKGAFTSLGDWTETSLKSVFEIKSPSERTAREVGEPMGEGLGVGMVRRFTSFMQGEGAEEIRRALEELLKDPKIKAFLDTIQWAEGGAPNRIVGGRTVSDLSKHPNIVGMITSKGPSTAAGSYQITGSNWYGARGRAGLQSRLGLPDFSAHSQQLAALQMLIDRGALPALQSGNIGAAMGIAAKDWTSTPGSKIGGGGQRSEQSWMSHFNQFMGGKAIDVSNPMPVRVVQDLEGGAALLNRMGASGPGRAAAYANAQGQFSATATLAEFNPLNPALPAALDDVNGQLKDFVSDTRDLSTSFKQADPAIRSAHFTLANIGLGLPPMMKGVNDAISKTSAVTKEYQAMAREELIKGYSLVDQLSGAIGQISGMLPGGGGQVGKKRGLFSKILGFAAPFLSFIPGVGPIISQIAGMASNALGGNYAGVVSGLAGGLAPGGVFRAGPSTGGSTPKSSGHGRALGGPVRAGYSYIVGEHRPELFTPERDGYIHPSVGGGLHPEHAELLSRLARALDRFESMPAHEVVRTGAHGLMRAMDGNAAISEGMGRRLRLA